MNSCFSVAAFANPEQTFGFSKFSESYKQAVSSGVALGFAFMQKEYKDYLATSKFNFEQIMEASGKDVSYSDLNKAHQQALFSFVYDMKDFDISDPKMLANFKSANRFTRTESERYYQVVSAVETVLTPAIASAFTGTFAEVQSTAWGDTAEFTVESNEILLAQPAGSGASGYVQRKYRDTVTINPIPYMIRFDTDWYQIAAGKADFGQMYFKAGRGFVSRITVEAYNQLLALAAQVPAYNRYVGITTENVDLACMATQGANNEAQVSIIGTLPALRQLLPTNDALKVGIGEEWNKMGYVGTYAGYPVVRISNLLNPATINSNSSSGTPSFLFRNDLLFVLPFAGRKPIKIVFEGEMFDAYKNVTQTGDKTESAELTYRFGIKFVYDQIIGVVSEEALS